VRIRGVNATAFYLMALVDGRVFLGPGAGGTQAPGSGVRRLIA
jgi:hypothetical protein